MRALPAHLTYLTYLTHLTHLTFSIACHGQEYLKNEPSVPPGRGKGAKMDYGPVVAYTINCKKKADKVVPDNLVLKGLAIKVGMSNEATVCFDTELVRYAAGWTGGFLDISTTHLDTYKGSTEAFMDGELVFSTKAVPGCGKL